LQRFEIIFLAAAPVRAKIRQTNRRLAAPTVRASHVNYARWGRSGGLGREQALNRQKPALAKAVLVGRGRRERRNNLARAWFSSPSLERLRAGPEAPPRFAKQPVAPRRIHRKEQRAGPSAWHCRPMLSVGHKIAGHRSLGSLSTTETVQRRGSMFSFQARRARPLHSSRNDTGPRAKSLGGRQHARYWFAGSQQVTAESARFSALGCFAQECHCWAPAWCSGARPKEKRESRQGRKGLAPGFSKNQNSGLKRLRTSVRQINQRKAGLAVSPPSQNFVPVV